MQETKTQKEPIIIPLSHEEYKNLEEKQHVAMKGVNYCEILEITKIFPLKVEYLNAIKEWNRISDRKRI